eukprot:TRINITY_DN12652_c0_g1_i1.p1 TRINITY_DN12652_c0_g1~~TRINITY_DN12652_c0_g1_i1.p1  ORF type:complete len:336 (-),score=66.84 TRINITY_DN12652_c0_g1_i1:59-1066(-)
MTSRGQIFLNLDKPYYMAGDLVQGNVEIDLYEVVHARRIGLKWKGVEKVQLAYSEQVGDQTVSKIAKEKVDYFQGESDITLYHIHDCMAPGHYSYPFSYQLPSNLPGVFFENLACTMAKVGRERGGLMGSMMSLGSNNSDNNDKGVVMYKVKVYFDVQGKDLKQSLKFCVAEPVVRSIEPFSMKKDKSFTFSRGRLHVTVNICKNVFVPGEFIPVEISCDNQSGKRVEAFKVKLVRELRMKAQRRTETHSFELYRQTYDGVEKHSKGHNTYNFQIRPDTLPSTNGRLIHCCYYLSVEADVKLALDLEFKAPCVIALLPAPGHPINLYASYTPFHW